MIKTMVFDLGNVLIDINISKSIKKLISINPDLNEMSIKKIFNQSAFKESYERGHITSFQFYNTVKSELQIPIPYYQFKRIWQNIFEPNMLLISLLPLLKKHYKLILLSNTNELHAEYCQKEYNFLSHFDKLVFSYETGYLKPETEIFQLTLDITKSKAGETVYIDDSIVYIQSALKLGINAIQYTGFEDLQKHWKKYDIEF